MSLTELNDIADTDTQEVFSLTFCAENGLDLQQGTYEIENNVMGTIEIFLVPIRRDETGFYMEAVFNRFKEKRMAGGGV